MTFLEIRNHVASVLAEVAREEPLLEKVTITCLQVFDATPTEAREGLPAEVARFHSFAGWLVALLGPILMVAQMFPDPKKHPGEKEAMGRAVSNLPKTIARVLAN